MRNFICLLSMFIGLTVIGQNSNFTRVIDNDSNDVAQAGLLDASGNYLVLSTTTASIGGSNFQVTKTDALGATLWSYVYGTTADEYGLNMKQTPTGDLLVVGYRNNGGDDQAFISKINSSGSLQWTKEIYTDSNSRALDVIVANNGFYYVTGYIDQDTLERNILVFRTTTSGGVSWIKTYGGDGDDVGYSLVQDAANNIVIGGSTANDSVNIGSTGDVDISVLAINTSGTIIKSQNFGTINDEWAKKIVRDGNNLFLAGDAMDQVVAGKSDVFVMKMDTNFNIAYSSIFNYLGNDYLKDVVISSQDGLFVAMEGENASGISEIVLFETQGPFGVINPGKFIGSQNDGQYGIDLLGTKFSGISCFTSGLSFGNTTTENIYLSKLDSSLSAGCNHNFANVIDNIYDLAFDVFGHSTSLVSNSTTVLLSRNSVTNSDTILCCNLSALVASDTIKMCDGDLVKVGSNHIPGYIYTWSANGAVVSTSANPSVSPPTSTSYKLVVSSADGVCTKDSATVFVDVSNRIPQQFISDTSFCDGDSVVLTAQNDMMFYAWRGVSGLINGPSYISKVSEMVTLTLTDANFCIYQDTIELSIDQLPTFSLGGSASFCENLAYTIKGPPSMATYIWNGVPSTVDSLVTNEAKIHTLEVVDSLGCKANSSIQLFTNPKSPLDIGPDTIFCEGEVYTLFAPTFLSNYKWNDVSSTSNQLKVNEAGTYWLEAYNSFGCPSFDTAIISVKSAPIFSLGRDSSFCDVVSMQLRGPAGLAKYLWFNGTTDQLYSASGAGLYYLRVTDNQGCSFTDSINLFVHNSPTITLGNDTALTTTEFITLSPGQQFVSYNWSTGESTSSIQVKDKGTYTVTVVDTNGCTGTAEMNITSDAGIAVVNGIEYKLYPNPASGVVHIVSDQPLKKGTLSIVDYQGKEVLARPIDATSAAIDVSSLASGFYNFIISQENILFNIRVVVKN